VTCRTWWNVFNTVSSTLSSTSFWVLIVCNMCFWFILVILHIESCLERCIVICVMCVIVLYYTVLYFTVLYCPVLHCSTLSPGIDSFVVNNNNNKKKKKKRRINSFRSFFRTDFVKSWPRNVVCSSVVPLWDPQISLLYFSGRTLLNFCTRLSFYWDNRLRSIEALYGVLC